MTIQYKDDDWIVWANQKAVIEATPDLSTIVSIQGVQRETDLLMQSQLGFDKIPSIWRNKFHNVGDVIADIGFEPSWVSHDPTNYGAVSPRERENFLDLVQ